MYAFDFFIIVSYFAYACAILGFTQFGPEHLQTIDGYVRLYMTLFLMWRFNMFRTTIQFTELDRKIVFSAALFMFTTTTINTILLQYVTKVKQWIHTYTNGI